MSRSPAGTNPDIPTVSIAPPLKPACFCITIRKYFIAFNIYSFPLNHLSFGANQRQLECTILVRGLLCVCRFLILSP